MVHDDEIDLLIQNASLLSGAKAQIAQERRLERAMTPARLGRRTVLLGMLLSWWERGEFGQCGDCAAPLLFLTAPEPERRPADVFCPRCRHRAERPMPRESFQQMREYLDDFAEHLDGEVAALLYIEMDPSLADLADAVAPGPAHSATSAVALLQAAHTLPQGET